MTSGLLKKKKIRDQVPISAVCVCVCVFYSAGDPGAAWAQTGMWVQGAVGLCSSLFLRSAGATSCPSPPGWPAGCPLAKH